MPEEPSARFVQTTPNGAGLMSDLAGSVLPTAMAPARTVGPRGFSFRFDVSFTGIDSDARHIQLGTAGDSRAASEECTGGTGLGCNRFAGDLLTWTRFELRKGFPFGLELAGSVGHLWNSSLWSVGFQLHVALLEGYREGAWAYVPDLALRTTIRAVVGGSDFRLVVPSVDLIASKPLVFGNAVVLTPLASFQLAWVVADSELVDLTPNTNAYDECAPRPGGILAGCTAGGNGDDYNNTTTFAALRALRYRMTLGVQARYELVLLTAAFAFDLVPPGETSDDIPDDVGRQWTTTVGIGMQL